MMNNKNKALIVLFIIFMILPSYATAAKGVLSADAQMCLGCHSSKELTKQLESKETFSLYVNGDAFANSVHNPTGCNGCHMDISMANHPQVKKIKSKKEYSVNASKVCSMCHIESQLKKKPVHGYLITKAKELTCVECHSPHSIKRISEWKASINENPYCLTCHKHDLRMTLNSGEVLSLSINEPLFKSSVHGSLQCGVCHTGFSKTEHPARVFDDRRNYSIRASDVCGKCHADANKQYESSIHLTVLREGNLKASSCTDCHGSHSVIRATVDKTFGLLSCTKCHGDENKAYEKSIHNTARIEGKENAPICSSCHRSHDISVIAMTMKMKEVCLRCHKNIENVHKRWLSNPPFKLSSFAGLHLDTVACAACHSPGTKGGAFLCLYDRKKGKPFSEEEALKLLGMDSARLKKELDPLGKGVGSSELWNMIKKLDEKGADVNFLGRLDVRKGTEAHLLAEKEKAVKDCEYCHRADSDLFKNVSIVLFKADGRPTYHNAKQEVLGSILTILPANQFYVLGGTRIGLLDIIGIIAVLGGIAFPIGHITLRIVTSPIRTLRKMGKGGSK